MEIGPVSKWDKYTREELECILATNEHIKDVENNLYFFITELINRSLVHDKSKIEEPELKTFAEMTPKLKSSTYGSEEYKGFLEQMKIALSHHYANNRHHPEHFKDGIRGMNLVDLVEMVCDWTAAVKRHDDGDIYSSIEKNQKRFGYSDELKQILRNTVDFIVNR